MLAAVEELRTCWDLPAEAVRDGIANVGRLTGLFGRWTTIGNSPLTVADTGHNEGGWRLIVDELQRVGRRPRHLVMGFVADKDLSHILPLLQPLRDDLTLWFAAPSCQRGLPADVLAERAAAYGLSGTVIPDVNAAVAAARSAVGPDGFVLVAGSNFLIADLLIG